MTESVETINQSLDEQVAKTGKYLTFRLKNEAYGIAIRKVQEIIGLMDITKIPQVPDYVRGVINLRGKVIPITDLRMRFGLENIEDTEKTCVIVVEVVQNDSNTTIGIIVDEVSEVLDIGEGQIEPAPSFRTGADTNFISGMGKIDDVVVILLDIDLVLTNDEITEISNVA